MLMIISSASPSGHDATPALSLCLNKLMQVIPSVHRLVCTRHGSNRISHYATRTHEDALAEHTARGGLGVDAEDAIHRAKADLSAVHLK